jgi:hypothetical protein
MEAFTLVATDHQLLPAKADVYHDILWPPSEPPLIDELRIVKQLLNPGTSNQKRITVTQQVLFATA